MIFKVSAITALREVRSFTAPVPSAAMRRKPVAVSFSMASEDKFFVRLRHHFVTGELFADELVERLVVVGRFDHDNRDSANDHGRTGSGFRVAVGVRVAGDVEPVTAPAFAVVRRGEQAINERFNRRVRIANGLSDKRVHFLRRGRQAGEVEGRATDERDCICGWCEAQFFLREFREEKRIDFILASDFGIRDRRHRRFFTG